MVRTDMTWSIREEKTRRRVTVGSDAVGASSKPLVSIHCWLRGAADGTTRNLMLSMLRWGGLAIGAEIGVAASGRGGKRGSSSRDPRDWEERRK